MTISVHVTVAPVRRRLGKSARGSGAPAEIGMFAEEANVIDNGLAVFAVLRKAATLQDISDIVG